ncbi:hypothetical protein BDC45DRAFT_520651 [Circinella umbellata]|nr:hypothetical protein BDC45DRAFT_520651 [Circinella umbellata]
MLLSYSHSSACYSFKLILVNILLYTYPFLFITLIIGKPTPLYHLLWRGKKKRYYNNEKSTLFIMASFLFCSKNNLSLSFKGRGCWVFFYVFSYPIFFKHTY